MKKSKRTAKPPAFGKFQPYAWVRPDIGTVELFTEDTPFYAEWIKGEGADICVYRAIDTDRVVGAHLPWKGGLGPLKVINDAAKRAATVKVPEPKAHLNHVPSWRRPARDVPIQALREFLARFGPDVSVLVTWDYKRNTYQFVTIGSDQLYATVAVDLRDEIAKAIKATPLGPTTDDRRKDHPNVRLDKDQTAFILWMLGRALVQADHDVNLKEYIRKYHDQLLPIIGHAHEAL